MQTLTLAYGKTTLSKTEYFSAMVFNKGQWSMTLPVDSAKDAHRTAKEYRKDRYQTIVVRIDNIAKVTVVRDLLQKRYPQGTTKLKTINYTEDGIAFARLESNKPINLRLTNY